MSTFVMQPAALDLVLPWQPDEDQERKFKNLLRRFFIPLLILFLIFPFLPELNYEEEEPESDIVITKVLLKQVVKPKPVPIVKVEEKIVVPKPIEKIEKPKEIVERKPKIANIKTPNKKSKKSAEKTAVKTDTVKEKISVRSSQGLNELSNQLTALRGSVDLRRLQKKNLSNTRVGSAASSSRTVLGANQVTRKSGGVNVDGNLLKNESTTLAAHTTTAVDGLVEGGAGPSGNQSYLSSKLGIRDMESVRSTLERAKSNVYSLYQRALLEKPGLAGQFVFKLVIEPDGSISKLELLSSELQSKELEAKILARIKRINFGSDDVAQTPVEYKFNFLPS